MAKTKVYLVMNTSNLQYAAHKDVPFQIKGYSDAIQGQQVELTDDQFKQAKAGIARLPSSVTIKLDEAAEAEAKAKAEAEAAEAKAEAEAAEAEAKAKAKAEAAEAKAKAEAEAAEAEAKAKAKAKAEAAEAEAKAKAKKPTAKAGK